MVKTLERAFEEAATLPLAAQEEIGRQLLTHIEAFRRLRADINEGIRSLQAGEGKSLDVEEFVAEMHRRHAET